MPKMTFTSERAIAVLAQLEQALTDSPMTSHVAAKQIGICKRQALAYLRVLYGQGRIHVAAWMDRGDGYGVIARYIAGQGPDAPRPPKQTAKERSARNCFRRAQRARVERRAKQKEEEARAEQLALIEKTISSARANPFDALFRMAA